MGTTFRIIDPKDANVREGWKSTRTVVSGNFVEPSLGFAGQWRSGLTLSADAALRILTDETTKITPSSGNIQFRSGRDEERLKKKTVVNFTLVRVGYLF